LSFFDGGDSLVVNQGCEEKNMQNSFLNLLRCPACKCKLEQAIDCTHLKCERCGSEFPCVHGIPRFVKSEAYTESFGYQWNRFNKIQLDSYNGTTFSRDRLFSITEWSPAELRGKLVLDAGCGSGRFTEVAFECGASVAAVDLSVAVNACRKNIDSNSVLVCQASLFELPFESGTFDYVFCIGVLQHTPDPALAIKALSEMVKPGGQIALWIYELDWKSLVGTIAFKYALRPIVRRLSRKQQMAFCKGLVDLFCPLITWSKKRGYLGRIIMRMLPVASAHLHDVSLKEDDLRTWILLDTLDMYTPRYDRPQRYAYIRGLLAQYGFENIRRHPHGAISITGTRGLSLSSRPSVVERSLNKA
jgi:2-polyprenyl-3-methyl-5-hydroxy-6-metoxy-1,4-benzoquinol methylase